jgi:hypothetical protein
MNISKIALGPFNMLRYALHEYRREYHDYPMRIELHPVVYADLMRDIGPGYDSCLDRGKQTFMGIPLIASVYATRPKLITSTNEVKYL